MQSLNLIDLEIVNIPIEKIIIDYKVYPRKEIDKKLVNEYASLLLDGVVLDPVVLCCFNGILYVGDGVHRIYAHRKIGRNEVNARIVKVRSKREVLRISVRLNRRHGKRLNLKYVIMKMYLCGIRDLNIIASDLGVSRRTVEKYTRVLREELKKRIEKEVNKIKCEGLDKYQIAKKIEEMYNFPISPRTIEEKIKMVTKSEKNTQIVSKTKKYKDILKNNGEKLNKGRNRLTILNNNEHITIGIDDYELLFNTSRNYIQLKLENMILKSRLTKLENWQAKYEQTIRKIAKYNVTMAQALENLDIEFLTNIAKTHSFVSSLAREVKDKDLKKLLNGILKGDEARILSVFRKLVNSKVTRQKLIYAVRQFKQVSRISKFEEFKKAWNLLEDALQHNDSEHMFRFLHYIEKGVLVFIDKFEDEVNARLREELEKYFCSFY